MSDIENLKTERVKFSPDQKGKPIQHLFDEGVRLICIPPEKVAIEFSTVALAFNDLLRYIPSYGAGIRTNHEQNFENVAIKYVQAVYPDVRLKRTSVPRINFDGSVAMELWVQKFPNHIGLEQAERKESLPYAGYHSQDVDISGYGLGEKGQGFIYKNPESLEAKAEEKTKRVDLYAGMKETADGANNPTGEMKTKTSAETLYRIKDSKKLSEQFIESFLDAVKEKE